jgi:hypothetical protein
MQQAPFRERQSPQLFAKIALNLDLIRHSQALEYVEQTEHQENPHFILEGLGSLVGESQALFIQQLCENQIDPLKFPALGEAEALEKIRQGIPLVGVYLPRLDLSHLTLTKPVVITHSVIQEISFQNTICHGKLDFTRTLFTQRAQFGSNYSLFAASSQKRGGMECFEEVSFKEAVFLQTADFSEIHFHEPLYLEEAHFEKNTDFRACQFSQNLYAREAVFLGNAVFQNSKFRGKTSFPYAIFHEDCNFLETECGGFLDFRQSRVLQNLIFDDSLFEQEVNFSQGEFLGETRFEDCTFGAGAEFQQAHFGRARFPASRFEGWADFSNSVFRGELSFANTEFHRGFDCSEVQLKAESDFREMRVLGNADFSRLCASERLFFERSLFQQKVSLRGASFQAPIEFHSIEVQHEFFAEHTSFGANVDFTSAKFYRNVDFTSAKFSGDFYLRRTLFEQEAVFPQIQLDGLFDLSASVFKKKVNLKQALFQGEFRASACTFEDEFSCVSSVFQGKFYLTSSHCKSRVSLEYCDFKDKAFFEKTEFTALTFHQIRADDFLIRLDQMKGKLLSFREKPYENAKNEFAFLKKCFERQNLYDDMDWAYYYFKKFERKALQYQTPFYLFWRKILLWADWILYDLGCGYCTKPFRLVLSGIVTVFLFAFAFYFADQQSVDPLSRPIIFSGEEFSSDKPTLAFEAYLYFSFCNFVALGAGDTHANYYGWLKYGTALEATLGVFFVTLFVTTFTRKILR